MGTRSGRHARAHARARTLRHTQAHALRHACSHTQSHTCLGIHTQARTRAHAHLGRHPHTHTQTHAQEHTCSARTCLGTHPQLHVSPCRARPHAGRSTPHPATLGTVSGCRPRPSCLWSVGLASKGSRAASWGAGAAAVLARCQRTGRPQRHRRPQLLPVPPPPAWAIPSGSPLRLPGRRLALGGAGVSSARAEAPGRAREGAREGKLFAQEPRTRESQGPSPAEGRPGLPSLRVDWFLQNYCSGPAPFIQGPWPPHYGCRVALERGSGLAAAVFNPLVCQTNMRRSQRRLQGPKGEAEQRPATVATGRWTAKARPCPGPAGRGATHSPAALTGVSGLGPALS